MGGALLDASTVGAIGSVGLLFSCVFSVAHPPRKHAKNNALIVLFTVSFPCFRDHKPLGIGKRSHIVIGMNQVSFTVQFRQRIGSFRHAFAGIWTVLRTQVNAWVHAVATLVVCAAGFFFGVSGNDWCWLVVAMVGVWVAECFNTAFEFLADVVSPEFHPLVKHAKDIAAGAVLISAVGAAVIGLLVFWPYLFEERSEFPYFNSDFLERVPESSPVLGR